MISVTPSETLAVSDEVLPTLFIGVLLSTDTVGVTDQTKAGFIRWANPEDTVAVTDQFSRQITYERTLGDAVEVTDLPHTWSIPDDGELSADLEGNSDLTAVLVKRTTPGIPAPLPARNVMLPRPPKVFIDHNVVRASPPPRRQDR